MSDQTVMPATPLTISAVFKNRDELLQQLCIKLFGAVPKYTDSGEPHTTRHECEELRAQLLQVTKERDLLIQIALRASNYLDEKSAPRAAQEIRKTVKQISQ